MLCCMLELQDHRLVSLLTRFVSSCLNPPSNTGWGILWVLFLGVCTFSLLLLGILLLFMPIVMQIEPLILMIGGLLLGLAIFLGPNLISWRFSLILKNVSLGLTQPQKLAHEVRIASHLYILSWLYF